MIKIMDHRGIRIEKVNKKQLGDCLFATTPYTYFLYRASGQETLTWADLRSCTLYVLSLMPETKVVLLNTHDVLYLGDSVQLENTAISIHVQGYGAEFLVVGTSESPCDKKEILLTRHAHLYKVDKPWGHELWINGEHPSYCLKQVYIKAGTKTSLQYHRFKQETNVLFEGEAKIHYKNSDFVSNDEVRPENIDTVCITPISVIDVNPDTLHRVEAITNITLYEVSTPYLDDVIRVQDDAGRSHGRITSEHHHNTH